MVERLLAAIDPREGIEAVHELLGPALAEVRAMLDETPAMARGRRIHDAIDEAAAALMGHLPEGTIAVRACPGCGLGFGGGVLPVAQGDVFGCDVCGGSWRLADVPEDAPPVWERFEAPDADVERVPIVVPTSGRNVLLPRAPMSERGDSFPGEE